MQAGEAILVFPGGAREVSKRKGEKYRLVWGNRLGFARLAIEHACTVVPFCCVGVEDAFDIVLDADEIMASRFGRVLARLGLRRDLVWPIVKGIGPTPLPRPERQYFRFMPPIETSSYQRQAQDAGRCADLPWGRPWGRPLGWPRGGITASTYSLRRENVHSYRVVIPASSRGAPSVGLRLTSRPFSALSRWSCRCMMVCNCSFAAMARSMR